VVGHPPPPFFRRGPAPFVRFVFFVTLAVTLLAVDLRFKTLELLRQAIGVAAYPVQQVAALPVDGLRGIGGYFSTVGALQDENRLLHREQVEQAGTLLRQQQLEQENQRLRALLEMKERLPSKGVVAEVSHAARDPFSRKVVIDKGSQSSIQAGQPVIDDVGVIGQVTRVYLVMSEVTLLSDKDQAIPLQVQRNGLRAVAYGGAEGGMLDLRFMAANADIRNGDTLVTSGIDGTYPPGLPVATVARIERDAAYAFAKITLTPTAGTDRYRQVLVLSAETTAAPPVEIEQPAQKPSRSKRSRKRD
jgi:rod shape-determining protein MreC